MFVFLTCVSMRMNIAILNIVTLVQPHSPQGWIYVGLVELCPVILQGFGGEED